MILDITLSNPNEGITIFSFVGDDYIKSTLDMATVKKVVKGSRLLDQLLLVILNAKMAVSINYSKMRKLFYDLYVDYLRENNFGFEKADEYISTIYDTCKTIIHSKKMSTPSFKRVYERVYEIMRVYQMRFIFLSESLRHTTNFFSVTFYFSFRINVPFTILKASILFIPVKIKLNVFPFVHLFEIFQKKLVFIPDTLLLLPQFSLYSIVFHGPHGSLASKIPNFELNDLVCSVIKIYLLVEIYYN